MTTDILNNAVLLIETLQKNVVGDPEVMVGLTPEALTFRFEWHHERWGYEHHIELAVVKVTSDIDLIRGVVNAACAVIEERKVGFSTSGNQWS